MEARTEAFQPRLHRRGRRRMQQTGHHLFARCDQLDLITAKAEVVGELAADQAGAQQQHTLLASRGAAKTRIVFQVVDREDRILRVAFDRHTDHLGPPGQHQVAIGHGLFADPQLLVAGVDAGNACVGADLGLELFGHGARFGHAQTIGVLVLAKAGGQHRLGVGAAIIGGDQQQRRFAVQLAKFPRQVVTGQAGTDDHHRCTHLAFLDIERAATDPQGRCHIID
ncbi:hypothetical protein D9M68_503930 [compost metagenome]